MLQRHAEVADRLQELHEDDEEQAEAEDVFDLDYIIRQTPPAPVPVVNDLTATQTARHLISMFHASPGREEHRVATGEQSEDDHSNQSVPHSQWSYELGHLASHSQNSTETVAAATREDTDGPVPREETLVDLGKPACSTQLGITTRRDGSEVNASASLGSPASWIVCCRLEYGVNGNYEGWPTTSYQHRRNPSLWRCQLEPSHPSTSSNGSRTKGDGTAISIRGYPGRGLFTASLQTDRCTSTLPDGIGPSSRPGSDDDRGQTSTDKTDGQVPEWEPQVSDEKAGFSS